MKDICSKLRRYLFGGLAALVLWPVAGPAANVTLQWDAPTHNTDGTALTDLTGYKLYHGLTPGSYTDIRNLGAATTAALSGLSDGVPHYFAVAAVNGTGAESMLSSGLVWTAPPPPAEVRLLAPVNNALHATAPAVIALEATVSAAGRTVTAVQFLEGESLLAEVTVAPYRATWQGVDEGVYAVRARARFSDGSTQDSTVATVTVIGVPSPYQVADVGTVSAAGSAGFTSGSGLFTVKGSGAGITDRSDEFFFVYQTMSGNGEIVARIPSVQNTSAQAVAGVMIRETLATGARQAFVGRMGGGKFRTARRGSTGGTTAGSTVAGYTAPNNWVRLVRTGSYFYFYRSANGTTWQQIGARAYINMGATVYVGLAVTSASDGVLSTATFDRTGVIP